MPVPETDIYPWQRGQWAYCRQRLRTDRFPHALLLCGPPGVGKERFALTLANSLLCETPRGDGGTACGDCGNCRSFSAGMHPDARRVAPEEDSTQIRVDAIRELNDFIALSRRYGAYKLAVIHPAEAMNRNAANGVLKTLEEPPPRTLILLVSARPDLLPATIRSRCQTLRFQIPPREQAVDWLREAQVRDAETLLAMAQGAPLAALALAAGDGRALRRQLFDGIARLARGEASAVALAADWHKLDGGQLAAWLWSWSADLIRLAFDAPAERLENPDFRLDLQGLRRTFDLTRCHGFQDNLLRYRGLLSAGLSQQLLMEDLLLAWASIFERGLHRMERNIHHG